MSTNTQILKGLRCPECLSEGPFVVQVTMNVVMDDDGIDWGMSQPEGDHFPGRPVDDSDGFEPESPIQCSARRGCGHYGTVESFAVPAEELAELEARLEAEERRRDAELVALRERLAREDG